MSDGGKKLTIIIFGIWLSIQYKLHTIFVCKNKIFFTSWGICNLSYWWTAKWNLDKSNQGWLLILKWIWKYRKVQPWVIQDSILLIKLWKMYYKTGKVFVMNNFFILYYGKIIGCNTAKYMIYCILHCTTTILCISDWIFFT